MRLLHLFFGNDEYLVSQKARETIAQYQQGGEMSCPVEVVEADVGAADAALVRCMRALRTSDLFCSRKIVWLKDVSFLSSAKKSEALKARLEEIVRMVKDGLPSSIVWLVTATEVDRRGVFCKVCVERGEVLEFSVPEKAYLAERAAQARLEDELRQRSLRMDREAKILFLQRVGPETRPLIGEVEKLDVFLGSRRDISVNDVRTVTSVARGTAGWDLADSVGKRNLGESLRILRVLLAQKETKEARGLLYVLEERVRSLIFYRQALDNGWLTFRHRGDQDEGGEVAWGNLPPEVDGFLGAGMDKDPRTVHPYRAGLLVSQARRYSLQHLEKCQDEIAATYRLTVSSGVPPGLLLERLLFRMLLSA